MSDFKKNMVGDVRSQKKSAWKLWSDTCGAQRLLGYSPSACRAPSCRSFSAKEPVIENIA